MIDTNPRTSLDESRASLLEAMENLHAAHALLLGRDPRLARIKLDVAQAIIGEVGKTISTVPAAETAPSK